METNIETLIKTKRIDWIDFFRGMAMLFVIIGHVCKPYFVSRAYYVLTSPIKIPLFFAITGYVFKFKDGNTKVFFTKCFWGLVVPWFLLSLYPLRMIVFCAIGNWDKVVESTVHFITGKDAWYMPCCIIAEIIFFFIQKLFKARMQYICMISFAVIGYVLSRLHIGDILNFNTALIAQLYILIGYIMHDKIFMDTSKTGKKIIAAVCALVYIIMVILTFLFCEGNIDVHMNIYYSIPICFLIICSGCLFLLLIGEFIKPWKWLCFIGKNTLVYYMLSWVPVKIFLVAVNLMHIHIPDNLIGGIILVIISCVGCAIFTVIINSFFPIAVGKKWSKRKILKKNI